MITYRQISRLIREPNRVSNCINITPLVEQGSKRGPYCPTTRAGRKTTAEVKCHQGRCTYSVTHAIAKIKYRKGKERGKWKENKAGEMGITLSRVKYDPPN